MSNNKPIFSFAFATDLHFELGAHHDIPKANARISCLMSDLDKHQIDFTLLGGDVTQCGSAKIDELATIKTNLDKLRSPYFMVAGNHDLAPNQGFAARYSGKEDYHTGTIETSNFHQVFGDKGVRFSFIKENIHFIGISLRNNDPDGALDWLEKEVLQSKLPKIIMTHYGLYPPRNSGSPLESWGFARIATCIPRLSSIIEHPSSRVIAYLYGHNHINSVVKKKNVLHISGGGIQKGCTGYWIFNYQEDCLNGQFHLLSDQTLHNFNYHGIVSPEKCVDSSHKTVEEYHKGNVYEQSVKCCLKG